MSLRRALEQYSAFSRTSKSDLVREALKRYLRVAQFQSLRSELVQQPHALDAHTDEDAFRVVDSPQKSS